MTVRERAALLRVAIVSAAWALGETLEWQLGARALGPLVPAILAAAAYVATRDLGGAGGGDGAYWRGRRIDRGRWN
jgi:hypothetical protein